ncbi:hypothetical protein ACFWZ2_17600 [Streptomyces sp. NPDC059002]|uniref:hypothetical protein n=1 Tax=Streptomyces sp. NPDC059002 TaxID=3346690 RepID=UPI003687CCCF
MVGLLLFLVVLVAAIVALGLFGYGCGAVTRRGPAVRAVAALLGAVAAAAYALGGVCLGLTVLDATDGGADSAPMRPCRVAGPERANHVVDYEVEFVPLGFTCVVEDSGGEDYGVGDEAVPHELNLVAFGSGAAAVGAGLAGAYAKRRRAGVRAGSSE